MAWTESNRSRRQNLMNAIGNFSGTASKAADRQVDAASTRSQIRHSQQEGAANRQNQTLNNVIGLAGKFGGTLLENQLENQKYAPGSNYMTAQKSMSDWERDAEIAINNAKSVLEHEQQGEAYGEGGYMREYSTAIAKLEGSIAEGLEGLRQGGAMDLQGASAQSATDLEGQRHQNTLDEDAAKLQGEIDFLAEMAARPELAAIYMRSQEEMPEAEAFDPGQYVMGWYSEEYMPGQNVEELVQKTPEELRKHFRDYVGIKLGGSTTFSEEELAAINEQLESFVWWMYPDGSTSKETADRSAWMVDAFKWFWPVEGSGMFRSPKPGNVPADDKYPAEVDTQQEKTLYDRLQALTAEELDMKISDTAGTYKDQLDYLIRGMIDEKAANTLSIWLDSLREFR